MKLLKAVFLTDVSISIRKYARAGVSRQLEFLADSVAGVDLSEEKGYALLARC
jgi:hypothetical protein